MVWLACQLRCRPPSLFHILRPQVDSSGIFDTAAPEGMANTEGSPRGSVGDSLSPTHPEMPTRIISRMSLVRVQLSTSVVIAQLGEQRPRKRQLPASLLGWAISFGILYSIPPTPLHP